MQRINNAMIEGCVRNLRYYAGVSLDFTHSREYGYQLVVMRDNKGGIEWTLGRAVFGTGNFYDCIKLAADVATIVHRDTVKACGYDPEI